MLSFGVSTVLESLKARPAQAQARLRAHVPSALPYTCHASASSSIAPFLALFVLSDLSLIVLGVSGCWCNGRAEDAAPTAANASLALLSTKPAVHGAFCGTRRLPRAPWAASSCVSHVRPITGCS